MIRSVPRSLSLCLVLIAAVQTATTASDADTTMVPPQVNFWATRGLTQTASAEALGAGRMSFNLMAAWYRQATDLSAAAEPAPNTGADIITSVLAFSFGANENIELFGTVAAFGSSGYNHADKFGLGSITGGVQGTVPLPPNVPIRLGAQAVVIGGMSPNQINGNHADGYNYYDTRTGFDILGRAIESLVLDGDKFGFRLMLNEAFSTSVQKSQANLMLLSAGMQAIIARYYAIGVEVNSRTFLDDVQMRTDPLWLTPSVNLRGPFFMGLTLGADISLAGERPETADAQESLEPYRLFGGATFSIDVLARKRREAAEKQRREAEEKAALQQKTQELEGKVTAVSQKAREDSLAQARQADSLAQVARALAEKARADSLAMVKKLEEERNKRTDMEKQLLSTGMLVMDAVYFESGRTDISINSRPYLTIIAKMLAKYPKLNLEVGGHTDSQGGRELNMRLSRARAESVRMFLINVEPDLMSRLTSTGYGPTVPKADNMTADGRKINRRTELVVINKEALKEYNP